jgi:hypothetical protein
MCAIYEVFGGGVVYTGVRRNARRVLLSLCEGKRSVKSAVGYIYIYYIQAAEASFRFGRGALVRRFPSRSNLVTAELS